MEKKLYCSPDKKMCGVCAGIADYFNVDPTIIRIAAALIGIYTAIIPALIVYFVMALIMPKAPDNYYQLFCNTSKKLTKSYDKKIAGVCGGVAERFNLDPTIVRVLFVLLVVLLGSGLLAYIACAIIMPPCDDFSQTYNYNQPPYGQGNPYGQGAPYGQGNPYGQDGQSAAQSGPFNAPPQNNEANNPENNG